MTSSPDPHMVHSNIELAPRQHIEAAPHVALQLARRPQKRSLLARKSWVAYVRPLFWACIWAGVAPAVLWRHFPWIGLASIVLGAGAAVHRTLQLRSEVLWMDEYGVTLESGVFPWQRGELLVRWRDIETVGCGRTIMRWALNYSTVCVWQRYKDEPAMVATDMAGGAHVCSILNSAHLQWIEDRACN